MLGLFTILLTLAFFSAATIDKILANCGLICAVAILLTLVLVYEDPYAGDIVALVGLKDSRTGDTLCDPNKPVILEKMEFPDPVIEMKVEPKTKGDQEKMTTALIKLANEDPSFRVTTDQESGQTILKGMGELHQSQARLGVHAERGAPGLGIDLFELLRGGKDPGVEDQHVQAAEAGRRLEHRAVHVGVVAHVHGEALDRAAFKRFEAHARVDEAGPVTAGDDHVHALDQRTVFLRENLQHRALLALVAAGDDDDFVALADLAHYRTSGASEMIFIWFLARSSRVTGPKMRVPIGSPWSLMRTAALRSKRM